MATITAIPTSNDRRRAPAPPPWALSLPATLDHSAARDPFVRDSEREHATVLIVDINGSTALSRSIDAQEWWTITARLFELMSDAVHASGGRVRAFTGDGILAVFGPQGVADDHAQRACEAALALRDAIRGPAAELRRDHDLELSIRIGINSGELITGIIGTGYRRCCSVSGYAVALAKRMETLAEPDRICLSESTAGLLGVGLEVRSLGSHEVKGAPKPVGVFELMPAA
ncbi:MAG: adenylate/guanylate cyclase domain-containing protein [Solirubrobacteraceae bacterium]